MVPWVGNRSVGRGHLLRCSLDSMKLKHYELSLCAASRLMRNFQDVGSTSWRMICGTQHRFHGISEEFVYLYRDGTCGTAGRIHTNIEPSLGQTIA